MPEPVREQAHEPEPEPAHAPSAIPTSLPALPARVLALQRSAGNAAVSRWLTGSSRRTVARDGTATAAPPAPASSGAPAAGPRVSYVFLMGDFKNDNFYLAAKEYFVHQVPSAILVTRQSPASPPGCRRTPSHHGRCPPRRAAGRRTRFRGR